MLQNGTPWKEQSQSNPGNAIVGQFTICRINQRRLINNEFISYRRTNTRSNRRCINFSWLNGKLIVVIHGYTIRFAAAIHHSAIDCINVARHNCARYGFDTDSNTSNRERNSIRLVCIVGFDSTEILRALAQIIAQLLRCIHARWHSIAWSIRFCSIERLMKLATIGSLVSRTEGVRVFFIPLSSA